MPRKLALEPENLKKRYILVRERYDHDIFSKASNLYHFCFYNMHSYQIMNLKKKVKKSKSKVNFPFLTGGEREWPMIYTFLLSELLKDHYRNYWEDAIFIIYFTYYTGFNNDSWAHLNYNTLYLIDNIEEGMAKDNFKKAFQKVSKYNFSAKVNTKNDEAKRFLIEKVKSFKKKYSEPEKVEIFLEHAHDIIKHGL